jgi:hypothetical protein
MGEDKAKNKGKGQDKGKAKGLTEAEELFWDCAAQLLELPGVTESTMFGFRCLRVENEFVGMPADNTLWVKLPATQVGELIDSEVGEVCAPNGRPFREWVCIRSLDEDLWLELLTNSIAFVRPANRARTKGGA